MSHLEGDDLKVRMDSFKDVIKVNKKALRYNLMLLKLYQNDKKSRDLKSIADLKENNGI